MPILILCVCASSNKLRFLLPVPFFFMLTTRPANDIQGISRPHATLYLSLAHWFGREDNTRKVAPHPYIDGQRCCLEIESCESIHVAHCTNFFHPRALCSCVEKGVLFFENAAVRPKARPSGSYPFSRTVVDTLSVGSGFEEIEGGQQEFDSRLERRCGSRCARSSTWWGAAFGGNPR